MMGSADGVSGDDDFRFAPISWARPPQARADEKPPPEPWPEEPVQEAWPEEPAQDVWADEQPAQEAWADEQPQDAWGGGQSEDGWGGPPARAAWSEPEPQNRWDAQPSPFPEAEPEEPGPVEESVTAEQPDPLADLDLTHLLRLALQTVRAGTMTELAAAGYEQLGPLNDLAFAVLQARGGCTTDELGEAIGVATPEAVQLAKELERGGYLRRIPGPRGARHPHYVITSKAQQHLRAAGYVQARQEARLAEGLGGDGLSELRTRLVQLVRAQAGTEVPPLRPIW